MSYREVPLVPGEYFHIYNRGNSKQHIFRNASDYTRFTLLLYLANDTESYHMRDIIRADSDPYEIESSEQLVYIHAYCLMPNHYHLILSSCCENGISQFMQKIGTGYSMYFNKKYERTGSLFEGKFKSKHADTDEYLKYLFSYIHMNPLALKEKNKVVEGWGKTNDNFEYLLNYMYSSLPEYQKEKRPQSALLHTKMYEKYFNTKENLKEELWDWLEYEYAT